MNKKSQRYHNNEVWNMCLVRVVFRVLYFIDNPYQTKRDIDGVYILIEFFYLLYSDMPDHIMYVYIPTVI